MELVTYQQEKNQVVVSSKDIAANFGKEHRNVLRDISNLKDVLNFEQMFYETTEADSYGRQQRVFLMNRDGFSLLVMGFTGKDALDWKVKYIGAFNAMESKLNSPEFIIQRAMGLLQKRCDALLLENQEMKPKADFYDSVADSKTALPMDQVAKTLAIPGVGRNNMFKLLREKRILQQNNIPYQEYVDRGYFRVVEQKYTKPNGEVCISIKTLVYQKGLDYIRKLCEVHEDA